MNLKINIKVIFSIILTLAIIATFASCGNNKKIFSLEPFSADFSVETSEMQIEGKLKYASATEINATITSPENIAGMKIYINGSDIKINCGDLIYASPSFDKLTKSDNIFVNLFEALGAFGNITFELSKKEKNSFKGEYTFGTYTAVIDGESNTISSLEANGTLYIFTYDSIDTSGDKAVSDIEETTQKKAK